jgi:PAS domain-containing protein
LQSRCYMNRKLLTVAIVGSIVLVALLDFWTPAERIESTLFMLPLALCAMQRSNRLLWGTAAAVVLLTIAAEFWGFNRAVLQNLLTASVNRGPVIASLLTLATFIHIGINQSQKILLDAGEIEHQRHDLSAQKDALRESEENYRMLLDGVQNYAIFMMDPRGQILSWNAGAELIKGYKADEIIGHNFSCMPRYAT